MASHLVTAALATALLCGAAVRLAHVATSPHHPDAPGATRAPATATRPGTLVLTVAIDHRGVQVLQATRKPDLPFRSQRRADELEFRWDLVDRGGLTVASGGFDPAQVCLDPSHAGLPPHVEGDVQIPHVAHVNVKIPDLADVTTITFALRRDGQTIPFGSARRDALTTR